MGRPLGPRHRARAGQSSRRVASQTTRRSGLLREMQAFLATRGGTRQVTPVADLLRETASVLRHALPPSVHLVLEEPDQAFRVDVDVPQIQQALMNLVINASHAVDGSGRIELAARGTREQGDEPGNARIQVRDDGEGMSSEVLARVFDPYFTTRSEEGGSGLGLAMVHGTVVAHGGTIRVRSELNKGTTFTIQLPLADRDRAGGSTEGRSSPSRTPVGVAG